MASASPEKAANRLVVKEATMYDDNSLCGFHRATMDRLSLFIGDVLLLKTERGRTTICVAVEDGTCEVHELRINKALRSNLRARVADVVSVHPCDDVKDGRHVHVLPVDDAVEGITGGDLFENYLRPYFHNARRPVRKGDRFLVGGRGGARSVEFKVVEIDDDPAVEFCHVSNSTVICCEGEPVGREEDEERLADEFDLGAGRAAIHHVVPNFQAYSHEALKRGEYCAIRWIWH